MKVFLIIGSVFWILASLAGSLILGALAGLSLYGGEGNYLGAFLMFLIAVVLTSFIPAYYLTGFLPARIKVDRKIWRLFLVVVFYLLIAVVEANLIFRGV